MSTEIDIVCQVLKEKRESAALSSEGISNSAIYNVFTQLVANRKLQGDLLDFGAGKGYLSQLLSKLSCFSSIIAIDIIADNQAADPTVEWITWDLNNTIDTIPDQTFDIIVSAEVIEHLENPRAIVREWHRLLRPGGTVIFSTPNNESWRSLLALLFQGHFVAFGDSCYPAHITAILRKDIEHMLVEAGFSIPDFFFTDVGGIPKLPTLQWQKISGNFLKGLRYSDNLIAVSYKK